MGKITLITGGARSGKSRYALNIAAEYKNKVFLATAMAIDDEMAKRIQAHKEERDASYVTAEEPYDLAPVLKNIGSSIDCVIIDCITVWLGNLVYKHGDEIKEFEEVRDFLDHIGKCSADLIVVTNEVGTGIIPDNKLAREYRDYSGIINQKIASHADEVILMVSGQPLVVKGNKKHE